MYNDFCIKVLKIVQCFLEITSFFTSSNSNMSTSKNFIKNKNQLKGKYSIINQDSYIIFVNIF